MNLLERARALYVQWLDKENRDGICVVHIAAAYELAIKDLQKREVKK